MKTALIALTIAFAAPALAQSYQQGYVRWDGQYVQGYMQTQADMTTFGHYALRTQNPPIEAEAPIDPWGSQDASIPSYGDGE
jgi:hypothetical protein